MLLAAAVLSPAVATTTLSDPGPLCVGETAVLPCSVADGVTITWFYRDESIGLSISPSQPPSNRPSNPVTVGGVQFFRTVNQNGTHLISQLSFTASLDMDGSEVRCTGLSGGIFSSDERTLQVEMLCKYTDYLGIGGGSKFKVWGGGGRTAPPPTPFLHLC